MSVETALGRTENAQDCIESYGPDSDQENVIPESVFADPSLDVHDIKISMKIFADTICTWNLPRKSWYH